MRSAIIPATGGIKIATHGVNADIIAVSSTFMPSSRIWIVKYGYNTNTAKKRKEAALEIILQNLQQSTI